MGLAGCCNHALHWRVYVASELKVPSDVPVDPIPDGDIVDSPLPDVENDAAQSSDKSGEEIPE